MPDDRERVAREQLERDKSNPDKIQEELKHRLAELEKKTQAEFGRAPKELELRRVEQGMVLEGWRLSVPERAPEHRRFQPSLGPNIPGTSQRARLRRDAPGRADPQRATRVFYDTLDRDRQEGASVTRDTARETYQGMVREKWNLPDTVRKRVFAPAELTRDFKDEAAESRKETPDAPERRPPGKPEGRER